MTNHKTHFADDDTLAYIAKLERDRARLVAALKEAERCMRGYIATGPCQICFADFIEKQQAANSLLRDLGEL